MEIDLKSLKRTELQKLAKENGIKANKKNGKIIQELTKLWKEKSDLNKNPTTNENSQDLFISEDEKENSPVVKKGRKAILPKPDLPSEDGDSSIEAPEELMCLITPKKTGTEEEMKLEDESDNEISFKIQTPEEKPVKRTRSSSRNKDNASSNNKVMNFLEAKTSSQKLNSNKTFSIPKNRTTSKLPTKKVASKRKSDEQNSVTLRTKRTKNSSYNEVKEREEVFKLLEKKTGQPASLKVTQIPRFQVKGLTTNNKVSAAKIVQAQQRRFDKMESIDDYQKRKTERANKLLGSQKKRDILNRLSQPKNKTPKVKDQPKASFISPAPGKKTSTAGKMFKPTITSTSKIQTNFHSNKAILPKKSLVSFAKTPDQVKNKGGKGGLRTPAKRGSIRTSLTPFKPSNANLCTPTSEKKRGFDLKESLKKPVTWEVHKGPLKKFNDTTNKPTFQDRIKTFKKAPVVSTRETRRQGNKSHRKNTKADQMAKRRGL